jgi:diguanylate cyclase (GGDEF)-like protein
LPTFTRERSAWLLICQQGCWDVLMRGAEDRRPSAELESIAERALAADVVEAGSRRIDGLACFPMLVAGRPVGMILVHETPALSPQDHRAIEAAAALAAISVRNVQMLIETREHSLRDALTGCFNRAHAMETLTAELRRAQRARRPLSLMMFDVDQFKRVNDSHGHLAGDQVLAEVGKRLGATLRTSDVKCRYGGDEFLVILPDTPQVGGTRLAETFRREISGMAVPTATGDIAITVSVGVITAERGELSAESLIAKADAALYRAKREGRNRVRAGEADAFPATGQRGTPVVTSVLAPGKQRHRSAA